MLKYSRIFCLNICCFFFLANVGAQSTYDFQVILATSQNLKTKSKTVKEEFGDNLKHNGSEIQFVTTGLFYIYKAFFSSQDYNSCVFHPSCSVYGVECLKHYGIFKGGMKMFDRLARCNGMSSHKYQKDFKRRLLLDPVTVNPQ